MSAPSSRCGAALDDSTPDLPPIDDGELIDPDFDDDGWSPDWLPDWRRDNELDDWI